MTGRGTAIVVAAWCAVGCEAASRGDRAATSAPAASSCKPEPPVTVEVAHRALAHDLLEVTVRATPHARVDALELGLVLPAHARTTSSLVHRFGATSPAQTRSFVAIVHADDRPAELASFARIPVGDVVMSRSAHVAIGLPPPASRTRVYVLPDGERVREVQP